MIEAYQIAEMLEELIGLMHTQAKEIERLIVHVEQTTGRLGHETQMPLVVSELSELHKRVRKLQGP
jgi:hypothetical protein